MPPINPADALLALMWGLVSGSALLIGAAAGLYATPGRRSIAAVMAFSSGILISVVAFDLMDEAVGHGGLPTVAAAFLAGAAVFTLASLAIKRAGGRHRKRSHLDDTARNATAIAVGSFIDGIPESLVIGLSMIDGEGVALATLAAIFLSNIPEALSSSAGMKAAGRNPRHVLILWGAIAAMSGILSVAGYAGFASLSPAVVAGAQAFAAGALLAMIADTMIPEAFSEAHDATGLVTAAGFLAGFGLSHGLG